MLYRVTYADGSEEVVDADNIADARSQARELYDAPIRKVVADDETVAAEDEDDEEDTDEDDASSNPEGDVA